MREYIVPVDATYRDYEEVFIGFIRKKHELIRCKDCKRFDGDTWCFLFEHGIQGEDFCSKAERKK